MSHALGGEGEAIADVLILGAGLTGLAVADHLAGQGLRVAVLEKEPCVGGLAKTVATNGFRVDLGGHRLYFQNPTLFNGVVSLMGGTELLKHARRSSVYTGGRFLSYPPELKNGIAGGAVLARAFWEAAGLCRPDVGEPKSLKDWVLAHFGPTIHDTYFKQYSRKVWGVETDRMSSIWAEKRIGRLNAFNLLKEAVFKTGNKEAASSFYYPRNGIGDVCERLYDKVRADVRVILDAEVRAIGGTRNVPDRAHFRSRSGDGSIRFGYLVSTIPVATLAQAMAPFRPEFKSMAAGIKYRDLAIVYVALSRRPIFKEHWVYFPEEKIPFSRVCELDHWSERMIDGNSSLLSCEMFCSQGDGVWNREDDELIALATRSLETLGFIDQGEVRKAFVLRVPYAYPLLYLGYEQALTPLLGALNAMSNVRLAGRTGTHSYYDMEECLGDAQKVAADILAAWRKAPSANRSEKIFS